jgi:hypothetical protein
MDVLDLNVRLLELADKLVGFAADILKLRIEIEALKRRQDAATASVREEHQDDKP